jgi:phosphoserine phosphatase
MRARSVVFDADSTLARLEGIDWLAARRGPAVRDAVVALTQEAMAGDRPLEGVYAERLTRIGPTRPELAALADAYVAAVEPGARDAVAALHARGVRVAIVSGGLRAALLPLAAHLGVPDADVHAVEIVAAPSAPAGVPAATRGATPPAAPPDPGTPLTALAGGQPLATQDGKVRVVRALLEEHGFPRPLVMVGDGSTDAVVRTVADAFVAYTGVVRRPTVVAHADHVVGDFGALTAWLLGEGPA